MSMACNMASAHDIAVANSNGKTIYYNREGSSVSVTYQGEYASSYSNEYTGTVVIPKTVTYGGKTYSVTSIGSEAFEHCRGLTSVTIPNSVTSIGHDAFFGCRGLTSVTIPNSVTSIGFYAFEDCSGLTSVSIPTSVASIGSYAFNGTAWYDNQPDGLVYVGNVAYKYKGTMPANTSITLKEGTVGIASSAFQDCSSLKSVTIPNSVTSIGSYAFKGCSGLTSVTIPNSVTSIGYSAFIGCSGLTSVNIPNSVTSIGEDAFQSCSGLTSITWNAKNYPAFSSSSSSPFYDIRTQITEFIIGDDVTSVPAYMCYGMSKLKSVIIPNSVTSIGERAFSGCSGLTSVTIPNSVTSIGEDAFQSCSGLQKVIVPNIKNWCSIKFGNYDANPLYYAHHLYSDENTEITKLVIPNNVTSINF